MSGIVWSIDRIILREEGESTLGRTRPSNRFYHKSHITGLGLNPVPRGDGPGTNPLILGTSIVFIQFIPPWLCFV